MEIEVGEYVRTNRGVIGKIIRIERDDIDIYLKWYVFYDGKNERYINKPYIVNHNKIISEIVEVGDYVNGKEVIEVREQEGKIYLMTGYVPQSYIKEDIKSIVTHEQFESIEYKVEEE